MKLFRFARKDPVVAATFVAFVLFSAPATASAVPTISAVTAFEMHRTSSEMADRLFSQRRGFLEAVQPGKYGIRFGTDGGLQLKAGSRSIQIRLHSAGFGSVRIPVSTPSVGLSQNAGQWPQVQFRRSGLTETYVNGAVGLHQSFQIQSNPANSGRSKSGRPWVRLQVSGADRILRSGEAAIAVRVGDRTFSYSGLSVWDAKGRELPAQMMPVDDQIVISVNDNGATYPLTIDPTWDQQQRFTGSDAMGGDRFGFAAGMSGTTAIFGAPLKSAQAGAAYLFSHSGGNWIEQQKITASDSSSGDLFGSAVSVSGNTAVVGAYGKNGNQGAVYVFDRTGTTWSQSQKLTASDGVAGDRFGFSVAISGDSVVIGAYQQASSRGAAYIFKRQAGAWSQTQKLTPNDGQASDLFGYSVAIDGGQLAIGATGRTGNRGAIYAFAESAGLWSQSQIIVASDAATNDNLGRSVALSTGRMLVGAFGKNASQGAAYMFTRAGNTWGGETKLTARDAASGDQFGSAVALTDTTAVVAAPGCDPDGKINAGAGYIYTFSGGTWSELQKITSSDAATSDGFGAAAAVSTTGALVTSWRQSASQGAAYSFGAPVASGISVAYPTMTLYAGVPGVYGGRSATGEITSTSPAPAGGTVVSLSGSIPEVVVPISVTIPPGATRVEFPITAARVAADTPARIRADAGVDSASGDFSVLANKVSVIRFAKTAVNRRGTVLLTVTLVSPALADFAIQLSSSDPLRLAVPAELVVLKDQTTVKAEVTAGDTDFDVPVKVVATPSNSEKSTTITVRANTEIASLSLQNGRIAVGRATNGTVRLTGPALPGGEDVVVESNVADVLVPDVVHVPAGQTTATFRVESQGVSACNAKIAAIVNDSATSKMLTVVRPKLESVTISPSTVKGGMASELTLNLTTEAPPEGVSLRLASSNSSTAFVPSSVVVPEGVRSFRVKITTYRWSNITPKSVKISAAIPGDGAKVAYVTVTR